MNVMLLLEMSLAPLDVMYVTGDVPIKMTGSCLTGSLIYSFIVQVYVGVGINSSPDSLIRSCVDV